MKISEMNAEQIGDVAQAANFKTGILKLLGAELEVEMRDDDGAAVPYVVASDGAATPLLDYFTAQGAETMDALTLGDALPNLAANRYAHNRKGDGERAQTGANRYAHNTKQGAK